MARRKEEEPIPADILEMSEAELRAEDERRATDRDQYEKLVQTRDEAQEALHLYVHRGYCITRRLADLAIARVKERESA